MRIRFAAAVVCLALFVMSGCGAIIVGGGAALGTYAYVNGEATGTYDATLDKAFAASKSACAEYGIPILKEEKDKSSAKLQGKLNGDTVIISMELVGEDITEISVRIGLWGNESASRRLHNAISFRL